MFDVVQEQLGRMMDRLGPSAGAWQRLDERSQFLEHVVGRFPPAWRRESARWQPWGYSIVHASRHGEGFAALFHGMPRGDQRRGAGNARPPRLRDHAEAHAGDDAVAGRGRSPRRGRLAPGFP